MTKIVDPTLKGNFIGAYYIVKEALGKVSVRRLASICGLSYSTGWKIANELETGETSRDFAERVAQNAGYKNREEYEAAGLKRRATMAGVSLKEFKKQLSQRGLKRTKERVQEAGESVYEHGKKLGKKRAGRVENIVFSGLIKEKIERDSGNIATLARQLSVDRVLVGYYSQGYTIPRRSRMDLVLGVLGVTPEEYQRRVEEERKRQ